MFLHEGNLCRFTFLLIHKYKLESLFNAVSLVRVCFPIFDLFFLENTDFWTNSTTYYIRAGEHLPKTASDQQCVRNWSRSKRIKKLNPLRNHCSVFDKEWNGFMNLSSYISIKFVCISYFFLPKPGWSLKCYCYMFTLHIPLFQGDIWDGTFLFLVHPSIWGICYFLSSFNISDFWNFVSWLLQ